MRRNRDTAILLSLLTDVLNGLSHLHAKGWIHRDLKPQNILLHKEGEEITAKISDFGISKLMESDGNSSSALLGTVEYMAPEQFNPKQYGIDGRISTNLDIWAFGVMIFELLTNRQLFGQRGGDTTSEQIMNRILSLQLPPEIDEISEPYRKIIKTCLVADAKLRIKKSSELINLFTSTEAKGNQAASVFVPEASKEKVDRSLATEVIDKKSIPPLPTEPVKTIPGKEDIPTVEQNENTIFTPSTNKKSAKILYIVLGIAIVLVSSIMYAIRKPALAPVSYQDAVLSLSSDSLVGINKLHQAVNNGSDSARFLLAKISIKQNQFAVAAAQLGLLESKHFPGVSGLLAILNYKGNITGQPDYQAAQLHFTKAAQQDKDTAAYYYLSEIYYEGKGSIQQDFTKAFKWASLAAQAGSVRGEANLAALYFNGQGVEQSNTNAFEWYTKAANGGDGYSNYIMGYFYEHGIVVQKDLQKAKEYYKEAANLGGMKQ